MLTDNLTFKDLFMQLGLPSSDDEIEAFISQHKGLDKKVYLADAPFWNDAQSTFIRTSLLEDAEWAELLDQLNASLR